VIKLSSNTKLIANDENVFELENILTVAPIMPECGIKKHQTDARFRFL
jgi:hypothetical protein